MRIEDLVANSPRLPDEIRGPLFEILGDMINEFKLPVQNMGVKPNVVEYGDICGYVERQIVARLRAVINERA